MPKSPSSAAQQAREALAARLKEIMKRAGMDGAAIAKASGWHASKSSRLLTATTLPAPRDIEAWCAACGVPELAEELISQALAVDSMYVEWKRLTRGGLTALQQSYVPLYESTRSFKVYSSDIVPGLLQTHAYAAAVLSRLAQFNDRPDDSEAAASARIARNRILGRPGRTFAFILEEQVLRQRVGPPEVMAAQLRHLMCAATMPQVSIGVIPFSAERSITMKPTFHLLDDARAGVELLTARVVATTPAEVSDYVKAFAEFSRLAAYGEQARALISTAIEALV